MTYFWQAVLLVVIFAVCTLVGYRWEMSKHDR